MILCFIFKYMKKILIIRFSSMGDIVLTSPVVRCIKQQKNIELHYLVKSQYSAVLIPNPYIDKLITFKNSLNSVITTLKNENYDIIIDLQNNVRSWWLKLNLARPSYTLKKGNIKKFIYIYMNFNYLNEHVVDRYFNTVKSLGVYNDNGGLDYFFKKNTVIDFDVSQDYIAWSIGGSFEQKKLCSKQIINVCNAVSHPIVLLGGVGESNMGKRIVSETTNKRVYNFCGQLSLDQSAYLLKNSCFVLTNDTGLMHIASALNKSIISFWGCTKPSLGFAPYLNHNQSIEILTNRSSPCSKHGSRCKIQDDGCIKQLDDKVIVRAVTDLLKG